ncbi:MAG: Cys-rich peptide radical SAM maturase CcpM [Caldicoprobacteraceae bacterium]
MSLLFHTFSIPGHWYVFDANSNCVFSVDEEQYKALTEIEHGVETPENLEILKEFQEKGFCLDANIESIYHPDTDVLEMHLKRRIQQVTLQVTQRCNLRCSYCAYSGRYENRTHLPKSMTFETAKRAIDMALSCSEDVEKLAIGFYGGEPLLEFPLIERCVNYIKQQAPDRNIFYTITTNGTLLTPEIYGYLAENNIDILISLDGPKIIHDQSRKFPDGKGSYDLIMENISNILNKYPESNNKLRFNAVISPEIDDSCLPSLFKSDDILSYYNLSMSFISDLYSQELYTYSEAFTLYYNHEVCKLLLSMIGKIGKRHVSPLLGRLESVYKMEYNSLGRIPKLPPVFHPSGPCLAGARRLFVDVNGSFFPCERVSESSNLMVIGDLDRGLDVEKAKMLLNPGQVTAEQCNKCWVIAHCFLCAAFSDNLHEISRSMRLSRCHSVRYIFEDHLKTICFLKESGCSFEEGD